jgi:hypothetical protein
MGAIAMRVTAICFCIALLSSFIPLSFAQEVKQNNVASVAPSTVTATTGFDRLQFLQGRWQMQPAQKTAKSAELQPGAPYQMEIVPVIANRYLRATGQQDGTAFELTFGYDEKRHFYRLSILDSYSGMPDFYQGHFNDQGVLLLTNDHGFRLEIKANQQQGWTAENYFSKDDGKTWQLYGRHIAEKKL